MFMNQVTVCLLIIQWFQILLVNSQYFILKHMGINTVAWRQKIAILFRMQFLNDIIKSRHGFKTAQKIHKFRVFIKTLNL